MSPLRTANRNGVVPALERARRSAPNSSSADTIALSPSAAAHISAVCPLQASFAFTSAPASASALTASYVGRACRRHQRRLAGIHEIDGVIRVRAGLEQQVEHGRVALLRGEGERRDAIVVREIDVGASADQRGR